MLRFLVDLDSITDLLENCVKSESKSKSMGSKSKSKSGKNGLESGLEYYKSGVFPIC